MWQAWQTIFGNPGETVRQGRVLLEFMRQHPDGKTTKGKKRGSGESALILHTVGCREETEDQERHSKLDYEAFAIKMERKRKWTMQQSYDYWEKLKARPDIEKDLGGPTHSKLRMQIPSDILAGGSVIKNKCMFEELLMIMMLCGSHHSVQLVQHLH